MTSPLDAIPRGLAGGRSTTVTPPSPVYRVYIRDVNFKRVAQLRDWIALKLDIRFNDVGTWSLRMRRSSPEAALLTKFGGIIVTRDDVTVFSGFVATEWKRTRRELSVAGYDDMALLNVPARPTPSQNFGPYPDAYDVRQGYASTIMIGAVSDNIGPTAPEAWRILPLTLAADPLLTGSIDPLPTLRLRLGPLLTSLREFAASSYGGGLRFTILQSDSVAGTLVFTVSAPLDRRASAKFSTELNTAIDYEDDVQLPDANWFWALGNGFDENRPMAEGGDPFLVADFGRRIGRVVDARDLDNVPELFQRVLELIGGHTLTRRITIQPFEVPSLVFGTHYDMGDIVTFTDADGAVVEAVVRQVTLDFTPGQGVRVTPMIGDAGANDDDPIVRHMASTLQRVSNLERNYGIPDNSVTPEMLVDYARWNVGDLRMTARASAAPRWLLCHGQAVSRTTYAVLFANIGTAFGAGDGSTTFNVPDFRGRSPIGAGGAYSVGQQAGAATANVEHAHAGAAHTHPGSHSHSGPAHTHSHTHSGAAHSHSHTHSIGSHNHSMSHSHSIDHDHASFQSGRETDFGADAFGRTAGATTGTGHRHNVDVPTYSDSSGGSSASDTGSTSGTTGSDATAASAGNTGSDATAASAGNTGSDSTAHAASFSATTGNAGSTALAILHPVLGANVEIYAAA